MDHEQTILARLDAMTDELARVTDGLEAAITKRYDNILVSCTEAARHLECTPNTISMMLKDGRLDKVTIGQSTGIRYSDILAIKTK